MHAEELRNDGGTIHMTKQELAVAKTAGQRARTITAARRKRFLEKLAETANITHSAKEAGIARSAAYRLRSQSVSFRAAWDEAMNQALDDLEAMLLDRAVHGVEKPVFYGGKACGTVRHYSDALAIFFLRARRPEVYGRLTATAEQPEPEDDQQRARAEVHARLNRMADQLLAEEAEMEMTDDGMTS